MRADDQQRLDRLNTELAGTGLDWQQHYCLVEEGPDGSLTLADRLLCGNSGEQPNC